MIKRFPRIDRPMIKTLKIVIKLIWVVTIITLGTAIGALFGWENHGWLGAIVSGTIGLGVGAFVASSPSLLLQILR